MQQIHNAIKTDNEFQRIKLPLSEQDYAALEENLFDNGCSAPILVWNDIIIDGYKRFEICTNWQLPFSTKNINFKSRDDAIAYICTDQLKRFDLPQKAVSYLIGKLFEAEKSIDRKSVE